MSQWDWMVEKVGWELAVTDQDGRLKTWNVSVILSVFFVGSFSLAMPVRANHVYVIPPNADLLISRLPTLDG